ncbi:mitogen-activated protein kinase kinase kinase 17-like [Cucurbita moschata]|uniref:Mitogen-activated protein kinase kinase kinase 17-like n=1 Tax=Cucurbita moschata TaxID=3662 RepID=A0A6J1GQX8_CUCMO|nr:mitogen-activated protein kinase kinase kinase 17-like [Cucurbita moschata]
MVFLISNYLADLVAYSLNKEALILSKFIGSPQILQLIGHLVAAEDDGKCSVYNLGLEYAAGGSLDDLINQRKKLPEDELKGYLRMMLTGLSCIHSKGFVHCDFKPSNVLVFPSQHGKPDLKIADEDVYERTETKVEFCVETRKRDKNSDHTKGILQKCFQRDPKQRWSAEMLLQHPYLVEENEITEL